VQTKTAEAEFTLTGVFDTVASAVPDRVAAVQGARRVTYKEMSEHARRLASYLHERGLGVRAERSELAGHESGQDLLGIVMYNSPEYIEAMLGCMGARVAPFNVNYRYVGNELRQLLLGAGARGLLYHASLVPVLGPVIEKLGGMEVLIQVDDESGYPLLPGATSYEQALAASEPAGSPVVPRSDDLYVLFTGGTTGSPKGVLWRQHDIFMAAMGGRRVGSWETIKDYDEIFRGAQDGPGVAFVVVPPLMHGGAQWTVFHAFRDGNTVVFPEGRQFDAAQIWKALESEQAVTISVIGDAMVRPLLDELDRSEYDTSSLMVVGNGGAPLTSAIRTRLLDRLPKVLVTDTVGASETGAQMNLAADASLGDDDQSQNSTAFSPAPGTLVLDPTLERALKPGDPEIGWLGQSGWVPLGYLGDPEKTAKTFPVIGGIRYSVPGDRARRLEDGRIELLGRDSLTVNTGGEKVFVEEVEAAITGHPAVADVVVTSAPSERWGRQIVAVVQKTSDVALTLEQINAFAAESLARYKLPKRVVFVNRVMRSPSGKADYRWAEQVAADADSAPHQ
jgi:3-oxocholest-4-en-26-oate---CoA ligase